MASTKRPTGYVSERVARNLKLIRTQRGLSTYQLADRLKGIGWPIAQTGLARIENAQRQVNVDDLLALSIVLDVSPGRLLLPDDISVPGVEKVYYVVTPETRAEISNLWRWMTGEEPLVLRDRDGKPLPDERTARELDRWVFENLPHKFPDVSERMLWETRAVAAKLGIREDGSADGPR